VIAHRTSRIEHWPAGNANRADVRASPPMLIQPLLADSGFLVVNYSSIPVKFTRAEMIPRLFG
jgi:hypothetical protein